ncbi:MAG TPA: hypothetical protein VJ963_12620 [Bacteroidales bacterium]|nr:hypothetical protein [Bacteroidales bacterium]
MRRRKCSISIIVVLILLVSVPAISQQISYKDSLAENNTLKENPKPGINYSVGSSFMYIPHYGSVTGLVISPSISVPLSSKWSVSGGIIAERYYSTFGYHSSEGLTCRTFNNITLYGSASYHVSPKLTLYGIGTKRLTNNSPFYPMPKSSYAIGSRYNFGDFSIGLTLHVSKWNDTFSPVPFNSSRGFYSPYGQGPGILPFY